MSAVPLPRLRQWLLVSSLSKTKKETPLNQDVAIARLLDHHVNSLLNGNVAEILSDYSESSLVYTPEGPVQGLKNLENLFVGFLATVPSAVLQKLKILRQDIFDGTAYILWQAGDEIPLGTDTYIIRDGKIAVQSFAAYLTF